MPSLPAALSTAVEACFPTDFLSTDSETLAAYGRDWTRVHPSAPSAVAFPRSTHEVARFLALCNEHRVAVVPSGGRTGLAGGAVAAAGEVVLSTDRMRHIGPVDTTARTVTVQAGAVTKAVHEHCAEHGLSWPIDFASAGSSQVGGNIATNAGGVRVVRYGLTRHWVLGLQVVTMDGSVLELNGALEKNNTGLDMRQVFIGTEGTLGVVTEATLKLAPMPYQTRVALLAVDDLRAALRLFESARNARGFELLAFELVTKACMQAVLTSHGGHPPLADDHPAYVLVELELPESSEPTAGAERWLEQVFADGLVKDGVLAQSATESTKLWALREDIGEALAKQGFLHKNDVAVPVSQMPAFVEQMQQVFTDRYPELAVYVFGHIGDGNLHINVMKPDDMETEIFLQRCHETDKVLFELVQQHRGSISAEHGIGLLKKAFLGFSRTAAELAWMRQIKHSFDPHGLLNPGKIFD